MIFCKLEQSGRHARDERVLLKQAARGSRLRNWPRRAKGDILFIPVRKGPCDSPSCYSPGTAEAWLCDGRRRAGGFAAGWLRGRRGNFFSSSGSFLVRQVDGYRARRHPHSGKSIFRPLFWKLPRRAGLFRPECRVPAARSFEHYRSAGWNIAAIPSGYFENECGMHA
jgi:hypothetical protein